MGLALDWVDWLGVVVSCEFDCLMLCYDLGVWDSACCVV